MSQITAPDYETATNKQLNKMSQITAPDYETATNAQKMSYMM